jgi:thymidylate synthase ThyX
MTGHNAKILADSMSPEGARLTTLEVTFPRIILAEFNTHRVFSRNSASSRAIPVEKMLKMVKEFPYIPTHWGQNQKGMQAEEEVDPRRQAWAETEWLEARNAAVEKADQLLAIGIHKQITNRLLEPFMWHTVIVTSTEWDNWTHLRDNEMAHPEIQKIAHLMVEAMSKSTPQHLTHSQWHLPLIREEDYYDAELKCEVAQTSIYDFLKKVSVGRCARVSYLTHDGKRDLDADVQLADRLLEAGHMSPFEHVARPMTELELECYRRDRVFLKSGRAWNNVRLPSQLYCELKGGPSAVAPRTWNDLIVADPVARVERTYFCNNFNGWIQHRAEIPYEWDLMGVKK